MRHCPSARARPGALMFGVATGNGQVAILAEGLPVDDAFLAEVAVRGRPEARFRFAQPCAQGACVHWDGHCRFGAALMAVPDGAPAPRACAIRVSCRWFAEQGPAVCTRCPAILTDIPAETVHAAPDAHAPGGPALPSPPPNP